MRASGFIRRHHRTDAADQAAAAEGRDDGVDRSDVLDDLGADGGVAGHDGGLATGWKNTPTRLELAGHQHLHQSSKGMRITWRPGPPAPRPLVAAALSGTTDGGRHAHLARRAGQALSKLPALAPSTPPRRVSGSFDLMALTAARILNEPKR